MPVQFVKGVGPARAKAFENLGVKTLADLLEYFPRDWVFMPDPVKICDLHPNENATVAAMIEKTDFRPFGRQPVFKAVMADDTGVCQIIWFHGGYLKNKLTSCSLPIRSLSSLTAKVLQTRSLSQALFIQPRQNYPADKSNA